MIPHRFPFGCLRQLFAAGLLLVLPVAAGAADTPSLEQRLRRLEERVDELSRENAALRRETGGGPAESGRNAPAALSAAPVVRLTGDLRSRFASTMYRAAGAPTRDQLFTQVRVGFIATPGAGVEGGLRISGGDYNPNFGGAPGSAQFSAGDNGAKKIAYLDQAFLRWRPALGPETKAAFTVGKSDNLFFVPSGMLFDKDYTPEGLTEEVAFQLSAGHRLWFAAGQYMLDELTLSTRDPLLLAGRARWEAQWDANWSSTAGVGQLTITHGEQLTAANVANNNRGNTRTAAGVLTRAYRPFYAEASVTRLLERAPGYAGKFPITFHADLLHNPGAPAQNDAWSLALTLGKAGKAGQWEVGYRRMRIEADAWFEEMLESDFGGYYRSVPAGWNTDPASLAGGHGGGTNFTSDIFRTSWSPRDYLLFSVNLFLNDLVKKIPAGSTDTAAKRVQLEGTVRF